MEIITHMLGHDLDDQRVIKQEQEQLLSDTELRSIKKFDGKGDPEQWLIYILEKFDSLQIKYSQRNKLIPDILTGEALIWYVKYSDHIPTFISFIKIFLQYYGEQRLQPEPSPVVNSSSIPMQQSHSSTSNETIMDCLQNLMLITNLNNSPKFSGKSKQNVSNWLREIQQQMDMYKLTDNEKLLYVPLCLEADMRDWFYDNPHLCSTWISFIQHLLKLFEPVVKADISFNHLNHYEHSINQDVRSYYVDIMKLCNKKNLLMNGGDDYEMSIKNPSNIEKEPVLSTNAKTADTNGDIINPLVCQQLSEINQPIFAIQEDNLNINDTCEVSIGQQQILNLIPNSDEPLTGLIVDNLASDNMQTVARHPDIFKNCCKNICMSITEIDLKIVNAQHFLKVHHHSMIKQVLPDTNTAKSTTMIVLTITMIFGFQIYGEFLPVLWFKIQPFDPGGVVSVKQAVGFICLTYTMGGGVRICHLSIFIYIYMDDPPFSHFSFFSLYSYLFFVFVVCLTDVFLEKD